MKKMPTKFDPKVREKLRRQAAERGSFRRDLTEAPQKIYRNELFRAAKARLSMPNSALRYLAEDSGIPVNTIRQCIAGNPVSITSLFKLSRYFGIPWKDLFDIDHTWPEIPDHMAADLERRKYREPIRIKK